jgi:hypothetical protein
MSNTFVLVMAIVLAGAGIDWAASRMGVRPLIGCALLPVLENLSAGVAIALVFTGVVFACFFSKKRPGVTLILGGLLLGILPLLVNGYLVRLTGMGCH